MIDERAPEWSDQFVPEIEDEEDDDALLAAFGLYLEGEEDDDWEPDSWDDDSWDSGSEWDD